VKLNDELIDKIVGDMRYEFARSGPPEAFPSFPAIPSDRYTSDEFWDLEQAHVFGAAWMLAGRAEQVPSTGDYFVFDDLGAAIVVVRGSDGQVRAYYNTCQHRGAPVVRDDHGSARRLRCQYHSWTYDIDSGALIAVPDERDFVDLDWEAHCLPPVRCEVFGGFIFVNRDATAMPLDQWLGAAAAMWAPMRSESLREVYRRSVIVPCNWKVTAEAFLEVYHFKHIHSHDGISALDHRGAAMGLYPNGHSRMVTPFSEQNIKRSGMSAWDDWKPLSTGPFPRIDAVPDMYGCTSTALSLFPNVIMPLGAFGFTMNIFWPVDKATTRLDWVYYAPKDWDGDEMPEHWQQRAQVYDTIMAEDMAMMAPMQRSIASPALSGITIGYQERRIQHLHEQIDAMIGVERVPQALRVPALLGPYVEH
jgi:phenylpropionate dioxygenase-like ring-hydroxylating dioxygenase large terminal subunit